MSWNIGREIVAIGLGLDITGAVFLGLGLLYSPMSAASILFRDEGKPVGMTGKQVYNDASLRDVAASLLRGRAGLLFLCSGFLLQLVGILVPSSSERLLSALLCAVAALFLSGWFGRNWIRRNKDRMVDGILNAPTVGIFIDLKKARYSDSKLTWKESKVLTTLRRIYT